MDWPGIALPDLLLVGIVGLMEPSERNSEWWDGDAETRVAPIWSVLVVIAAFAAGVGLVLWL